MCVQLNKSLCVKNFREAEERIAGGVSKITKWFLFEVGKCYSSQSTDFHLCTKEKIIYVYLVLKL